MYLYLHCYYGDSVLTMFDMMTAPCSLSLGRGITEYLTDDTCKQNQNDKFPTENEHFTAYQKHILELRYKEQ